MFVLYGYTYVRILNTVFVCVCVCVLACFCVCVHVCGFVVYVNVTVTNKFFTKEKHIIVIIYVGFSNVI